MEDGETRFVVATFMTAARVISRWGRHRWRIEAFFKTCKSRFGLARFAQATRIGAYRFLLLSFLAFTLTQWQLWQSQGEWPKWAEAATILRRELLPDLILAELMTELERLRPYLNAAETIAGGVGARCQLTK
jgi:Zn-dependent protease with chaperone function